jgi:hypothetical protein
MEGATVESRNEEVQVKRHSAGHQLVFGGCLVETAPGMPFSIASVRGEETSESGFISVRT